MLFLLFLLRTWCLFLLARLTDLLFSFYTKQVIIFPKELRESLVPPLCGVKHVKVQVAAWPQESIVLELLESLLWLVPRAETMSITSRHPTIKAKKPLKLKVPS